MEYKYKIWLEQDGQLIFGDGLYHLLTFIRTYGSIRRASEEMMMSYRQAWGDIKKAEERLNVKLLIKKTGGESGGGAHLTIEGEALLSCFDEFKRETDQAVSELFKKYFE